MYFTEMEDEEGDFIFLDQQQAFDKAEWGSIDLCLEKKNSLGKIKEWVQMLLKNAKTCIQTNGFTSRSVCILLAQSVKGAQ